MNTSIFIAATWFGHEHRFLGLDWNYLVILGFVGTATFSMRFLVQWWASERQGESVIPVSFWYWSIAGSVIMFFYFLFRRDPVGVLGKQRGLLEDDAEHLALERRPLHRGGDEVARRVGLAAARGEVALAAPLVEYDVPRFKKQGAPIDCIYPKDEVALTVRPATIPSNAPHPNAAQLFLNWRLSEEGQKLMQDQIGYRSVRQGIGSPAGLPLTDQLNLFLPDANDIAAQRNAVNQAWEQHFR